MNERRCRWHRTCEIVMVVTHSVADAARLALRRVATTTWIVARRRDSGSATWWDVAVDLYVTRCSRQDSTGATSRTHRSVESRTSERAACTCLSLSLFLFFSLSVLRFCSLSVPLEYPVCPAFLLSHSSAFRPRFALFAVRFYVVICSSLCHSHLLRDLCPMIPFLFVPCLPARGIDRPSLFNPRAPRVFLLCLTCC